MKFGLQRRTAGGVRRAAFAEKPMAATHQLMRSPRFIVCILAVCLVAPMSFASPTVLKIASVAPQGSPWVETLRELAGNVKTATDGAVEIKIYPDGIIGDEPDIVRLMRLGRLQGAALTQLALASIVPEVLAISTPFLVESGEEFTFLVRRLSDRLKERFEDEGFVALAFGEAGWIHFFSAEPIASPADLESMRLAVPAGDSNMLYIWRRLGFSAFALSMTDYAMGLQTGMVDAFYAPPSVVASFGWDGRVEYMNALPAAPVLGAIVLTQAAWRTLSEEQRDSIREFAGVAGDSISASSRMLEADSIRVMAENGLKVIEPDESEETQWRELGGAGGEMAVGRLFSNDALGDVLGLLDEYRSSAAQR